MCFNSNIQPKKANFVEFSQTHKETFTLFSEVNPPTVLEGGSSTKFGFVKKFRAVMGCLKRPMDGRGDRV